MQRMTTGKVVFLHVLGLHILQVLRSQPLLNRINGSNESLILGGSGDLDQFGQNLQSFLIGVARSIPLTW